MEKAADDEDTYLEKSSKVEVIKSENGHDFDALQSKFSGLNISTQTNSIPLMKWSKLAVSGGQVPKIKNHTATLVGSQIYIFGGYDGRRNHNAVHILDCSKHFP